MLIVYLIMHIYISEHVAMHSSINDVLHYKVLTWFVTQARYPFYHALSFDSLSINEVVYKYVHLMLVFVNKKNMSLLIFRHNTVVQVSGNGWERSSHVPFSSGN